MFFSLNTMPRRLASGTKPCMPGAPARPGPATARRWRLLLLPALAVWLGLAAAPAWAADQAPSRTISGANTGLNEAYRVAALADGSLAVVNYGNNSLTVYAANADGNATPTRTISGGSTGLIGPVGVAALAGGSLAVSNSGIDSVTVYAANANGNVAPTRTISGASTG